MMKTIDNFKDFVRDNPYLINYIRKGEKTWQDFYELYDLYGDNKEAWNNFLKEENTLKKDTIKTNNYLEEIVKKAKNIDMDKVQESITSLQKTLGLFGELIANKATPKTKEYNPRPLYRRFED